MKKKGLECILHSSFKSDFQMHKFNMHKLNTLSSSKSPLGRFYSTKKSTKSSKNHYDTLRITPHATQNEVKSAYYKLTLQYHPDKNKSDYAKRMFQDIAEAYEVLGNHDLRKTYDRNITIQQPVSSTAQEPTSHYRDKVYSGSSKIYNFDEWTQAHYGRQMHAARIRRDIYEQYKQMEQMNKSEQSSSGVVEIILVLLTITLAFMYVHQRNLDVPASKSGKPIEQSNNERN